jgi:hypothetical protein
VHDVARIEPSSSRHRHTPHHFVQLRHAGTAIRPALELLLQRTQGLVRRFRHLQCQRFHNLGLGVTGFPIVTSSILLVISPEQGPEFAAYAALWSITGSMANVSFGLAYS